MGINTLEYAAVFMEGLDQQLVENSTTGWMEDNAGQIQYNGGAEVKIPKMQLSGLGNYDRDGGFAKGAVTVTYETMEMTQVSLGQGAYLPAGRHGRRRNEFCGDGGECDGRIPEDEGYSGN